MQAYFRVLSLLAVVLSCVFTGESLWADSGSTTDLGPVTAFGAGRTALALGVPTAHAHFGAPKHEAYLCFTLASSRGDGKPPFRIAPATGVTNAAGDTLDCTTIDDDHPFVRDTTLTVVIKAPDVSLWNNIELVGLSVTSSAATPENFTPVRTVAAGSKSIAHDCNKAEAFCVVPADGVVALRATLRLLSNTAPTIGLKMAYSSKPISGGFSDTDAANESVISFSPITYPAVLEKYHFNVDTALIVSWIRNPTYSRVQTAPTIGTSGQPGYVPAQYKTQVTPGTLTVLPALMFTVYLPPRTIDRPLGWKKSDWIQRVPQPTFGISLTSPGSDFFVGGVSEVLRAIQIVGGLHIGKVNALSSVPFDDPTSSAAPATNQAFDRAGFVGIALNLDFIKTAFGK